MVVSRLSCCLETYITKKHLIVYMNYLRKINCKKKNLTNLSISPIMNIDDRINRPFFAEHLK